MFNYQMHYERIKKALEELWDISTDSSITEENKVKIIRDVSRATLDGEPTTADEHNFGGDTGTDADYNVGTCEHINKTYQAEERDTNVPESYTCNDCGEELDIPEPDFDLMRKE